MPTKPSHRTVPQLSQLKLTFAGPLWADQQVEVIDDLKFINYLYIGKLVWVISQRNWYTYVGDKINNDGTKTPQWEPQSSRSPIYEYSITKQYFRGDIVYLGGKIYTLRSDVALPGDDPQTNSKQSWLAISGEIPSRRYEFRNQSVVTIATDIANPIFDTWITDPQTNTSRRVFVDFEELAADDETFTKTFKIRFYENGELTQKTGFIVVK